MNTEEIKEEELTKPLRRTVKEILVERVGKPKDPEIYSSTTEFLIIFPNEYSISVTQIKLRSPKAKVRIYYKIGDITPDFLPGKTWKRVDRDIISSLIDRLSTEHERVQNPRI